MPSFLSSATLLATTFFSAISAAPYHAAISKRAAGPGNQLVAYFGQSAGQLRLRQLCDEPDVDIIPFGFVDGYPYGKNSYGLDNNGYISTNFGDQCGGDMYQNTNMFRRCSAYFSDDNPDNSDIAYCQSKGKKILISIGGGASSQTYRFQSADEARLAAQQIWESFGPVPAQDGPRPFGKWVVDGFDLDLEKGGDDFVVVFAQALRNYIDQEASNNGKSFILTAAPQCIIPDAHLTSALQSVAFDKIFVQFYNNPSCAATAFKNPSNGNRFNFDDWAQTSSFAGNPEIFIGLPGSSGPESAGSGYVDASTVSEMVQTFGSRVNFGGIMLWDITTATNNKVTPSKNFLQACKDALDNKNPVQSSSTSSTTTMTSTTTSLTTTTTVQTTTTVATTTIESTTTTASTELSTSSSTTEKSTTTHADTTTVQSSSSSASTEQSTTSATTVPSTTTSAEASTTSETSSKTSESSTSAEATTSLSAQTSTTSEASSTSETSTISSASTTSSVQETSTTTEATTTASSSEYSTTAEVSSSSASDLSTTSAGVTTSSVAETSTSSAHVSSTTSRGITSSSVAVTSSSAGVSSISSRATSTSSAVSTTSGVSTSIVTTTKTVIISSSSSVGSTSSAVGSSSYNDWVGWSTVTTSRPVVPTSKTTYAPWSAWDSTSDPVKPTSKSTTQENVWGVWDSTTKKGGAFYGSSTWAVWQSTTSKAPVPTSINSWESWKGDVTVTSITTTYVDVCPTGYTTITATITATITVIDHVKPTGWPHDNAGVPTGFTTTKTLCKAGCAATPVTVTVTVPVVEETVKTPVPTSTAAYNIWETSAEAITGKPTSTPTAGYAAQTGTWSTWSPESTGVNGVKAFTGGAAADQAPATLFSIAVCFAIAVAGLVL